MQDHAVFITDLHFWSVVKNPLRLLNKRALGNLNVIVKRRHHFPLANARPFAKHALSLGASTVICGGDVTSTATREEFAMARAFMDEVAASGVQILMVPGNHDVYTFEAARARRFEQAMGPWVPAEGYPARVELPGGTPVVLLSTVGPNWISSKGRITEAAIERAAELVTDAASGPVLVVGHYPLLDATAGYRSRPGRRLTGAPALRAALGATGRQVVYVAGHVHRFSEAVDELHPNIRQYTSPALFNHWAPAGRFGGFLELRCGDGHVEVSHHWNDGEWQSEMGTVPGTLPPVF